MYRDHCYNSIPNYQETIQLLSRSPHSLVSLDRIIQFPFTSSSTLNTTTSNELVEKSQEELTKQTERRKEATRRLQEQAARQRLEKQERQQEELTVFGQLRSEEASLGKSEWDKKLKEYGFSGKGDLEEYLKKLEKSLERARNKELGIEEPENKVSINHGVFTLLLRERLKTGHSRVFDSERIRNHLRSL